MLLSEAGQTLAGYAKRLLELAEAATRVLCVWPNPADTYAWTRWKMPPAGLQEIYTSFVVDEALLQILLETRPAVVSLHFDPPGCKALRAAGIYLMTTATQPGTATPPNGPARRPRN